MLFELGKEEVTEGSASLWGTRAVALWPGRGRLICSLILPWTATWLRSRNKGWGQAWGVCVFGGGSLGPSDLQGEEYWAADG